MKQAFLITLLAIALASCNQDKPAPATQPAPTQPASPTQALPSVPLDLLEKIWQEGTQVDYIFYNHPFTMSLSDKAAVQHAVRHVAETPAPLKLECKPMGRVSYQIQGNIVLEGDFYFSAGCTYFVFEKDRVKTYANYMTEPAIQYFNNQIKQATEMQQQVQQQNTGQ